MLMETQTFAMVWIEEKITLTLYTRYRQGDPGAPDADIQPVVQRVSSCPGLGPRTEQKTTQCKIH